MDINSPESSTAAHRSGYFGTDDDPAVLLQYTSLYQASPLNVVLPSVEALASKRLSRTLSASPCLHSVAFKASP
jgi:hypothetical protein